MSAAGFALLWGKILDSSIWLESKETRLVWITILAMKDVEGRVLCAPGILALRARVSEEECKEALRVLMSPDKQEGSEDQEYQGRRLEPIRGGWQVINHEKYRFSTEARREFWRDQKRKQREAEEAEAAKKLDKPKPVKRGRPLKGERQYLKAVERGDEVEADRIAAGEVKAAVQEVSVPEPVAAGEADLPCPEVSPGGVAGGEQVETVLADSGSDTDTEEISLEVPVEE